MKTKQEMKIASQIIQELSLFLLFHGYESFDIGFEETEFEEIFTIKIKHIRDELLEFMKEKINRKREEEIEAYYWELLGDMDSTSELEIMGLLIDHLETKKINDHTEICLIRKH